MRVPYKRPPVGAGIGVGCAVIIGAIIFNLLFLGAAVWVIATVIKAVFG